ncbi:MAG: hypothetical protein CM15mP62_20040 [Rhodospirillaceae bacterium]|nr:MAG: hypothetical protein CM15mP62_20040 [Rhodospirillaceae bacterium]
MKFRLTAFAAVAALGMAITPAEVQNISVGIPGRSSNNGSARFI